MFCSPKFFSGQTIQVAIIPITIFTYNCMDAPKNEFIIILIKLVTLYLYLVTIAFALSNSVSDISKFNGSTCTIGNAKGNKL